MTLIDADYYFQDGSLALTLDGVEFNIHKPLIERYSNIPVDDLKARSSSLIQIDDWRVFLGYLYKNDDYRRLDWDEEDVVVDKLGGSTIKLLSLIRISHSTRLDCPSIHQNALQVLVAKFPSGPRPFSHLYTQDPGELDNVLNLAIEFGISSVTKGILYTLVTTHQFHDDDEEKDAENDKPGRLSDSTIAKCNKLMSSIIDHFTPILFTPPPTSHMNCTDALAEKWMEHVIGPALIDDGVYKPLETLERLKAEVDWKGKGLCEACCEEKKVEWTEEQDVVWRRIDDWL